MNVAELPLHNGKAPRWLMQRMKKLGCYITKVILEEYGSREFIRRISNPFWFQAFALVLGFDWHSSGTTTTLIYALKGVEDIAIVGGKGKDALNTLDEISEKAELLGMSISKEYILRKSSILSAKVDNVAIQDGYDVYLHAMVFDEYGNFAVINQGMNVNKLMARRYHWHSHVSVVADKEEIIGFKEKDVLNIAGEKDELHHTMIDVAKELKMPRRHYIEIGDLSKRDLEFFRNIYDIDPRSFEELLEIKGLGRKRLRALALISNVIYGCELDWNDPVKYAYAHGGKDGIPFPVDKKIYDENIEFFREIIENSKLGKREKAAALKRLNSYFFSNI